MTTLMYTSTNDQWAHPAHLLVSYEPIGQFIKDLTVSVQFGSVTSLLTCVRFVHFAAIYRTC